MKRFLTILLISLLLVGCAVTEPTTTEIPTTEPVAVTEPAIMTEPTEPVAIHYSQEQAMIEGFLVMQLGDVRHNQQNWFDFLETSQTGELAQLNVIHFFDNGSGWGQILYELSFDGTNYIVQYQKDGEIVTDSASSLIEEAGILEDSAEPYDAYHRFRLNDLVLYEDLIIIPEIDSGNPISLHAKEGDPALQDYITDEQLAPIVSLLSRAEYLPCEPEDYLYGMKLLTADTSGEGIILELDLRYGNYRYGTQVFHYGDVTDLLTALGLESWPDSVLEEFKDFLN